MPYIGNTPTTQSFTPGTDYFNGTGSATVFTLNRPVVSINDIQVVVNNVVQAPNSGYTISGNTLTFDAAPSAGTNNVYVRYLTTTTQVIAPSTNSVSYASLTPDMQQDIGISFKNRIINGDMRIAQRGTSATFSGTGQNQNTYNTVDRFSFATYGGNFPSGVYATTAQVEDAPTGFRNSFRVTANQTLTIGSSNTRGIWVQQVIEAFNFIDCYNQPITLSFWVKSSNVGTYSVTFQNDNGGYATSYTINSANTWEFKTITLTHSTSLGTPNYTNTRGLSVVFALGGDSTWIGTATANQWVAGNIPYLHGCKNLFDTANATWQITGVQLEKGTTATAFDNRSYGTELHLCQRYYEQQDMTANGNDRPFAVGGAYLSGSNVISQQCLFFKLLKRATPTVTFSAAGTFSQHAPGAFRNNLTSIVLTNATPTGLQIMCTSGNGGGSPSVQSVCAILEPSSAGGTASIGISAEL